LPSLTALQDIAIDSLEHFWLDNFSRNFLNLLASGPDVLEENILSFLTLANRLLIKINIDSASKGISDNEGWRCEVVSTSVGMNTALEVTVTREDCSSNNI